MGKKIHKLEENRATDYTLFVISCTENDYRLIWILNNSLDFGFTRCENLEVSHTRHEVEQQFSLFEYHDEDRLLHFRLLSNRGENGMLLEEMTNIDYLLQVIGDLSARETSDLLARINALAEINLVYQVDPDSLKSSQKLSI